MKPPGSDFGAPPRHKRRVRLSIGYDGPVLRPTPNPPWAENDPREEGGRCRCLRCGEAVDRPGLCAVDFFRFWSRRLQHQQGAWRIRDVAKTWRDTVFREIGVWRGEGA